VSTPASKILSNRRAWVIGLIVVAVAALVYLDAWGRLDRATADNGRPYCSTQLRAEAPAPGGKSQAAARSTPERDALKGSGSKVRKNSTRTQARRKSARNRSARRRSSRRAAARPQPVNERGERVAGVAQLAYPFDDDRRPMVRHQPFSIPADMRRDKVRVTVPFGDLLDAQGRPLPSGQVKARVVRRGPGRLVTVGVCINPQLPGEMRGGTYTGAALVGVGDRVTPITLEATVRDDRWHFVGTAALIGVIAGLLFKFFADTASVGLRRNLTSPRILVAIAAGLVTGIYSYLTIYADDPTFHAEFKNLWRVTAEVFAGTLAAKALTDLARPSDQATAAEIAEKKAKEAKKAARPAGFAGTGLLGRRQTREEDA
jgi:hypothetical protein